MTLVSTERQTQGLLDSDDEKLFQSFKSYFSCAICLGFIQEPRMTPCGHLFCSDCIQRWIQSVYPHTYCPKCRTPFRMDDTIPMYFGQSAKSTHRTKQKLRKKMTFKNTSFVGYQTCGLLLYEMDRNDTLSLKSVAAVSLLFTIVLLAFFSILDTKIVIK